MDTNTQNIEANASETQVIEVNASDMSSQTVKANASNVSASQTIAHVGRNVFKPKRFVGNEDGSIKMDENGQPVRLTKGKPSKNTKIVFAIPPKRVNGLYAGEFKMVASMDDFVRPVKSNASAQEVVTQPEGSVEVAS